VPWIRFNPLLVVFALLGCSAEPSNTQSESVGSLSTPETGTAEDSARMPAKLDYQASEPERALVLATFREALQLPPNTEPEVLAAIEDLKGIEPEIVGFWGPFDGPEYRVDIKGRDRIARWALVLDIETGLCELDGVLSFLE
jgi:hypothetical protein